MKKIFLTNHFNVSHFRNVVLVIALVAGFSVFAARVPRKMKISVPKETIVSEENQQAKSRIKKPEISKLKINNIVFNEKQKVKRLRTISVSQKNKNNNRKFFRKSNLTDKNLTVKKLTKKLETNLRMAPAHIAKVLTAAEDDGSWYQYFFDDFEGAFPNTWALYDTPTWGTNDLTASTGNQSAWCAGYDYSPNGNYFDNMNAWMVQGPFDLSASDDVLLYFDFLVKSQPNVDTLFVGLSTDGLNFSGNQFSGDSGGWVSNTYIDAKDFARSNSVYVGVNFYSNDSISNYDGAFVDNVELIGYHLVSNTAPDLAVQNVHIQDSFDGIFNFDIKNNSAQNQPPKSYYISVFVDGALDSKETNLYELASGDTATWDWQLAYFYLPGTHSVKILVEEDGGDVNTNDNTTVFSLVVTNKTTIDLGVSNPNVVSPITGWFDFDVDNYGPAIAVSNSYLISVSVDGEFDSSARNSQPLFPGQYTTWQWSTEYIYPEGTHSVEVKILSDIIDVNSANDTITFDMIVPATDTVTTDLKLTGIKITDEKNAVFKFKVINKGPKKCEAGDYTIRVYVDNVLDSSTSNSKNLAKGVTAIWTWQLQYIYSPGLHKIKIDVRPSGGDLKPEDNTLIFQMVEFGANLQVYDIPTYTSVVGKTFSTALSATNGSPPYLWEISTGELPKGIYLNGDGTIFGIPSSSGNFSLKLKCSDKSGASTLADFYIIVLNSEPAAPEIIDTVLPVTFQDTFFQLPLSAVGGTIPYSWSFVAAAPFGINISSTGALYGTVSTPGEYELNVKVTDDAAASTQSKMKLRVLSTAQTINFQIKKLKIIIPWKEHASGKNNSDSVKLKVEFPAPAELVIGNYTRLTVFIGDYPVSFIKPAKSKLTKKCVFKTAKEETAKGKATVKKNKANITLSLSMKNIDLATALEKYGVKQNAGATIIFPIRISVSDCDSGTRESAFKYSESKSGKGKIEN